MTKDVISLSISVLLLFRHYISHKITFGAPSSGGVLCSACGAFIKNRVLFYICIDLLSPIYSIIASLLLFILYSVQSKNMYSCLDLAL